MVVVPNAINQICMLMLVANANLAHLHVVLVPLLLLTVPLVLQVLNMMLKPTHVFLLLLAVVAMCQYAVKDALTVRMICIVISAPQAITDMNLCKTVKNEQHASRHALVEQW